MLFALDQLPVPAENRLQLIVRNRVVSDVVGAGHRLGGHQRVDDGFFGGFAPSP